MEKPINLIFNHIQHIGIPVTDITASQLFYSKLGFNKVMEKPFTDKDGNGTCVMVQRGSIIIELYQLPDTALAAIRSRGNGHVDHVAFDVNDIDEAFEEISAAGFNV